MGKKKNQRKRKIRVALKKNRGKRARQGNLTQQELKVIEFNLAMKVTAGYTISFKSVSARSKGAISLAARAGRR